MKSFPTAIASPFSECNIHCIVPTIIDNSFSAHVHLISASLFFLVLAYFALFLFTKSTGNLTPQKKKRNRIYKTCGYIMLACILLLFLYFAIPCLGTRLENYKPVIFLETIALWAFGISWLIKGEFLLKDK